MKERPPRATRLCASHRASAKQKCGERIRTPLRLADSAATPKEKILLAFLIWRGWIFSGKGKGVFLSGFCPPSIRAGGVQMQFGLVFAKLFCGRKDSQKRD